MTPKSKTLLPKLKRTFELRYQSVSLKSFAFSEDEKRTIRAASPLPLARKCNARFVSDIEKVVSLEMSAPNRHTSQKRRESASRIRKLARQLHGEIQKAPEPVMGLLFGATEIHLNQSAHKDLSIADRNGAFCLSIFLKALERAADDCFAVVPEGENRRHLILNATFFYQAAFGLKPSPNKNSAYLTLMAAVNGALRLRSSVQFPLGLKATREVLATYRDSALPTAKRGRKT